MKYLLETSGVVSGLGKGVTATSIGVLFRFVAFKLLLSKLVFFPFLELNSHSLFFLPFDKHLNGLQYEVLSSIGIKFAKKSFMQ